MVHGLYFLLVYRSRQQLIMVCTKARARVLFTKRLESDYEWGKLSIDYQKLSKIPACTHLFWHC